MSTPNLKSSIEATAPYLKFVTNIKKDASGKPTVQITAKAPIGFVRGAAPQHPWSAGGLNFWLREAYRMRHFVLGFGTIGILYYRLAQSTIEGRKDSAYWNSTIFGVKSSHKHH